MWVKALMVLVTIVLIGLGTIYLLGIAERGRWERYAATLREAGEPLTFAEIEARRAEVPDERNSALVIISAIANLPPDERWRLRMLVAPREVRTVDLFDGIPRYVIEDLRAFFEQHRPMLDALQPVLNMPTGRITITYARIPANTLVPHITVVRAAADLAHLHAILRLIDGETGAAVDAAVLQLRIAGSLNEYPFLIGHLTELSIERMAYDTVEDLIRIGDVPDVSLVRLRDVLVGRRTPMPLSWGLRSERALFVVACERLISRQIKVEEVMDVGGGAPSTPGLNLLPEFIIRKNQLLAAELHTRLMDAGEDLIAMRATAAQIGREVRQLSDTYFLVKILMPSLDRAVYLQIEHDVALDCTLAGIAAERFRLATGHWPRSLDELVPAYLDQVPIDPFAEMQPLKLVATEQGIVIYSIGDDTIDDGGDVVAEKNQRTGPDLGFRLLDPEHRGVVITDEPRPEDE